MEQPALRSNGAVRKFQDEWLRSHPLGARDRNGVDLTLIRANLRLPVADRIRKAQNAANALMRFRDAIREMHSEPKIDEDFRY